jgi:hypothetical protein
MAGMRKMPEGTHRERVGDCRPARWYVIWLGEPRREGSVILGRAKRLDKHMMHRFFVEGRPLDHKDICGLVEGTAWLLEMREADGKPITGA